MDEQMEDHNMMGWRSPEESDDEMEIDEDSEEEEVDQVDEEKAFHGLDADKKKVLAVVKNNDTEEGADITSDFAHLGSKFLLRIQNKSHALLFDNENNGIYNYIQWAKTNLKKF